MDKEQEAIEVEVLAIDGIAPSDYDAPPQAVPGASRGGTQFSIPRLDPRWWPVWLLLGIVALFLFLTVGVVAGVLFIIYRIIRDFLSGLASMFKV